MAKKPKRPIGRPSAYKPDYAEKAAKICKLGATDAELADIFGVSTVTLNAWKHGYPEFLNALKVGKGEADDRVERSLFQRAIGYSHPDTHVSNYQGHITLTPITKHYPPDTVAAIFWLKNRRKDEWRDRHDHTHRNLTMAEIDAELAAVEDEIARAGGEAGQASPTEGARNGKGVH